MQERMLQIRDAEKDFDRVEYYYLFEVKAKVQEKIILSGLPLTSYAGRGNDE